MAALTWPLPPSTMTRSGIAQRRSSSAPSSPVRDGPEAAAQDLLVAGEVVRALTVRIRNRRYSPVRGLPSSKTTMLPTDSLPWKLLMS